MLCAFLSLISAIFDSFLLCLIFLISALFVSFFFRDPERFVSTGSNGVFLSPADEKVVAISKKEHHFLLGERWCVSIFMN